MSKGSGPRQGKGLSVSRSGLPLQVSVVKPAPQAVGFNAATKDSSVKVEVRRSFCKPGLAISSVSHVTYLACDRCESGP